MTKMTTNNYTPTLAAAALGLLLFSAAAMAQLPRSAAPTGAAVYFISPKNGETISGDVLVRFGLKGMGVAPAGVDVANTGHHHLLIDVEALPSMDQPIPADDTHKHFGAGQTEATLKLPPGRHTLQMLLGDKFHLPHQPPVLSERITITVKLAPGSPSSGGVAWGCAWRRRWPSGARRW